MSVEVVFEMQVRVSHITVHLQHASMSITEHQSRLWFWAQSYVVMCSCILPEVGVRSHNRACVCVLSLEHPSITIDVTSVTVATSPTTVVDIRRRFQPVKLADGTTPQTSNGLDPVPQVQPVSSQCGTASSASQACTEHCIPESWVDILDVRWTDLTHGRVQRLASIAVQRCKKKQERLGNAEVRTCPKRKNPSIHPKRGRKRHNEYFTPTWDLSLLCVFSWSLVGSAPRDTGLPLPTQMPALQVFLGKLLELSVVALHNFVNFARLAREGTRASS